MDNTLAQFRNILVLILLFAVTLSGFLGHTFEAGAIVVFVLFAVFLRFIKNTAPNARSTRCARWPHPMRP